MTAVEYAHLLELRCRPMGYAPWIPAWRRRLHAVITLELEKQQAIDQAAKGTGEQ